MAAYTGVMPLTLLVHEIWTPISEYYSGITLDPSSGNPDHIFAQAMKLPDISTNLIFLILIPLSIYIAIQRLRYLSKLRSEHNNIFEAHLGRIPFETDRLSMEVNKKKEARVENKKSLFQTDLMVPLQKSMETLSKT